MGSITAPKVFGRNYTTVSLLSAPQAMSHSMLDAYSSNSAGILLCLVFVIAIAFVGGAAICMAMIDADQGSTPRSLGMNLADPGGSRNHQSGPVKSRQPVPPVHLPQNP